MKKTQPVQSRNTYMLRDLTHQHWEDSQLPGRLSGADGGGEAYSWEVGVVGGRGDRVQERQEKVTF